MQILPVSQLKEGMIVAEPIMTKRGQVISKAGSELTAQLIARLSFYKIEEVSVEDPAPVAEATASAPVIETPAPAPVVPKETVSEQISYSQRLKASPKFKQFQMEYAFNTEYLRENFEAILSGAGSEVSSMIIEHFEVLYRQKTSLELLDMLHNMRGSEDTVFAHSINVSLIARAIGKWCKMDAEELNILTVAGLLHDIGKLLVPEEILNKQGKLTDEEFKTIQSHTLLGNKALKNKGFDQRILLAALQHHERSDGTGYPRGLASDEIEPFAAIIAIADVYDAMTAYRSYRKPLCAFQVIAEFEKDGLQKYETQYILTFLEHMAAAYQNSRVLLSDMRSGHVVYINQQALSRPVVGLDSGEIVDLSSPANNGLYIQAII